MDYTSLVKMQVLHMLMNYTLMKYTKNPVANKLMIVGTLPQF